MHGRGLARAEWQSHAAARTKCAHAAAILFDAASCTKKFIQFDVRCFFLFLEGRRAGTFDRFKSLGK